MRFEWDSAKEAANRKKHGLSFSSAIPVFMDPSALTVYDHDHSDLDEDRWISIGRSQDGIVCVVCHTYRSVDGVQTVRIISARRADRDEELRYYSL